MGAPRVSTDARGVAAVVVIALLARLLLAAALGGGFHFADEIRYVDAARRLWSGAGFGADYDRVPGYPVLLAMLGGPRQPVLWLRLAQAVLAAGGAALTFVLATRLAGRTAALAAAMVYALDPLTAFAAGLLYPEATAALLFTAASLAAISAARRDSGAWAAAAGALLGALALFRPVALALAPVAVAWIAVASPGAAARRAGRTALVVLVWLAVLAPWTYRNYQLRGRIVPIATTGTKAAGLSPEMEEQQGVAGALASEAVSDPGGVARRMVRELGHFWELIPERLVTDVPAQREALHRRNPGLPTTPVAPTGLRNVVAAVASAVEFLLAIIGLVVLWRTRRRETVLLVGLVLAFALGHSLFIGKMRYRITVLPVVFVFAGAGLAALRRATGSAASRRPAAEG
jgi:4-amino-4-deoxy-L-arabinose transferase-like glycosyltransferase